jgi:hypothetical protein
VANLTQTLGTLANGSHALQISFFGWHNVGSCETAVAAYTFSAKGTYNALGHSGSFDFSLELTDQSATSTSGPCRVINGGQTTPGTYTSDGTSITFSDAQHTITASAGSGGIQLSVQGFPTKGRIAQ